MTIRLITFDLDDTLWDVGPVLHSAELRLREWLASHAPGLSDVSIEALGAIRRRLLDADPQLRHRISELRRQVLRHALENAGYSHREAGELAERAFHVFLEARHAVQLFPEVHPTLEQLTNHYILGVLTNGNADVRRLGLADYFDFALCAEELGIGKPDPAPFREALRRANLALWARSTEEERARFGVHSERGPESYDLTFTMIAGHDRFHLDQARRALAAVTAAG